MFGGIQKDVSSLTRGNNNGGSSDGDTVSNANAIANITSRIKQNEASF